MTGSQVLAAFPNGFKMEVVYKDEYAGTVTWDDYSGECEIDWSFLNQANVISFCVYHDWKSGVMYIA